MSILSRTENDYIFSKVPRICVDLLIPMEISNRILVGKRNHAPFKDMWALPGGRVRFGESIEEAAKRVCETELGTQLIDYQQIAVAEFLDEIKTFNRHSISIIYLAQISGSPNSLSFFSEFSTNRHVDQNKIIRQHKEIIDAYLRKIDKNYEY